MKVTQVVFSSAVKPLVGGVDTAPSFSSLPVGARYRDAGYELETCDEGVLCRHTGAPGIVRLVPWAKISFCDVEPVLEPSSAEEPPKREHWKTRRKREAEEAAADAVQE